MHFSMNSDQLDDPMILPMCTNLEDIQFLLCVMQLNNAGFFFKALIFLVFLDGSVRDSCEPRFCDPPVRSMVGTWALRGRGGGNPTP